MAEPIRNYTPQRDPREELRRKVDAAPVAHADAVLAAYDLLQEAQDHGVLDALRGAIGGGGAIIAKVSEYANTPQGIRLMRNLLAGARLLGELDPAMLDAAAGAASSAHRNAEQNAVTPSLLSSLQRLAGVDSRRTLATVAQLSQSFGEALAGGDPHSGGESRRSTDAGVAVPVIAGAAVVLFAIFWIGRKSR